ncbi:MAG: hypothetical protein DCC68_17415 [Planctomycetota bacterium]|nr:MAG: hypothetical protein DCC68_17415 [Planctomycetota bacterium]
MSFVERLWPRRARCEQTPRTARSMAMRRHRARRRMSAETLERRAMLASTPLAAGAPVDELLPDMFAWASESRSFLNGSYVDTASQPGNNLLRFSTAVANIGQGPMELRGGSILPSGNQQVYQRVFREGGTFTDSLVGEFTYHATHQHIHFDGYAVYNLRQALVNDGVGDVVASGGKVSFCLLDVTRYDSAAPSARYSTCGQNQGISVGWADVYDDSLPDQWIDVTDVPDGEYWLEVVVDPENRLRESDETNNIARVRVSLGGGGELGDRFELNDSVEDATNFGIVGDRVENDLSIHAAGNDDYFRMEMAAAGTLDVAIAFVHEQGDLDIELLDAAKNVVATSNSTDDGERIVREVAAGEVYYLRVFEFGGGVSPDYDLSIDGPDGNFGDRFEPNDSFASAVHLGQMGDRVETGLSIHAPGNDDYYRFTAAATGTLDVSLNFIHALGDADMELYDGGFNSIAVADSTNDVELISVPVVAAATYYLHVYGAEDATNEGYTLTFDGPGGAAGDRFEANDDPASATDLGLLGDRTEANLSIHLPNNDDYYRFTAAGTGALNATLAFAHAEGDLDLRLLDAGMNVLAESISADDNEELTFAVDAGGSYYLHVYGFEGATNASYSLSIDGPVPSGNIAGIVWDDKNNDGIRDASEPGLPGRVIYVDANGNGQFDSFPPTTDEFVAAGLPLPIADHAVAQSPIEVSGVARPIESVSLQLSLAHSYVGDLHGHLVSPAGTRIELFSHVGGSGDDMTGTTFDDTAALSIELGSAPFTGAFRPLESLATFAGGNANGTWTLEIEDDEDGDEGSLLAWSLALVSEGYFEPSAATNAAGAYAITGVAPGEYTVAEELPPEWEVSFPAPMSTHTATVNVAETTGDVDFGNHSTVAHLARVIDVRLQRSAGSSVGYSLPVGNGTQLAAAPFVGIDQIAVTFDRAWNVTEESFELHGVNVANYATVGGLLAVSPALGESIVATWMLAEPLSTDKLLLVVHAGAAGDVQLDGEWTNPSGGDPGDVFPSGDGQPGGDFRFRFDVLPGDANGDGAVDGGDLAALVDGGFSTKFGAGYLIRNDLDGNGRVDVVDAVMARNHLGASLPAGEPGASPAAAGALVTRVAERVAERTPVRRIPRVDPRAVVSNSPAVVDRVFDTGSFDATLRGVRARRVRY